MNPTPPSDESLEEFVAALTTANTGGEMNAALPALYDELRDMAAGYLRRERSDHTLQPTALVQPTHRRLE